MIEFLKKNRFGRRYLPAPFQYNGRGGIFQREVLKETGVIGTADTLVHADSEYSSLVQYLLEEFLW